MNTPPTLMARDLDVVLGGVVGSTAYGLAGEHSDVDRLGVYLAPTRGVLGLTGCALTSSSVVTHNPDVALHELAKFATLALKANPTMIELLFLAEYEVCTEVGAALVDARHGFLCTDSVRAAFGGYATQQAHKLTRRHEAGRAGFSSDLARRTAKHARHCLRLLLCGTALLATGELPIDVSAHRDEFTEAEHLALSDPGAFHALFVERRDAMERTTSVLADRPDRARIEELVVAARLARIRQ